MNDGTDNHGNCIKNWPDRELDPASGTKSAVSVPTSASSQVASACKMIIVQMMKPTLASPIVVPFKTEVDFFIKKR